MRPERPTGIRRLGAAGLRSRRGALAPGTGVGSGSLLGLLAAGGAGYLGAVLAERPLRAELALRPPVILLDLADAVRGVPPAAPRCAALAAARGPGQAPRRGRLPGARCPGGDRGAAGALSGCRAPERNHRGREPMTPLAAPAPRLAGPVARWRSLVAIATLAVGALTAGRSVSATPAATRSSMRTASRSPAGSGRCSVSTGSLSGDR